ncbi:hypothetical protein ECG_09356 [Echinococcus granulosus]|nr:hypothetical protein ECG_09356 [Echinococcus granulosus]
MSRRLHMSCPERLRLLHEVISLKASVELAALPVRVIRWQGLGCGRFNFRTSVSELGNSACAYLSTADTEDSHHELASSNMQNESARLQICADGAGGSVVGEGNQLE